MPTDAVAVLIGLPAAYLPSVSTGVGYAVAAAEALVLVLLSLAYLLACGAWAGRAGRLPSSITRRMPQLRWLLSSG